MVNQELIYQIGLTLLPGIGSITAKNLISFCGGLEGIFKASKRKLLAIPGIGDKLADSVLNHADALKKAEQEVAVMQKNNIQPIFFFSKDYPNRLKNCNDAPIMLYYKGNANLNHPRTVSIVGTRNATEYGKEICHKLIDGLAKYNVLVVSGLAYGIDHAAHAACIQKQVPTLGVLAHGLDRIYPPAHQRLAKNMQDNGGLLTEHIFGTIPDKENFPKRNRIIAGLADATIVVETATKGGSIITAQLAAAYNRDVFAFPGKTTDKYSAGCNLLIKTNQAHLVESVHDIANTLGWEPNAAKVQPIQKQLFIELEPNEQLIYTTLQNSPPEGLHIDQLCFLTHLSPGATAASLLTLELKGLVKAAVGSVFKLC
ncbi:MAG TPA: DNA-processing protein DprA [Chitinophagales bacterium]|nr:DNA-processing protein DprA [Chitinophagales bacterium]